MPDLSDTMAKCRIGTAKFFTLLLLLYRTSAKWEDIYHFSEEEIRQFEEIIRSTAHLIMEFSQEGGFENASNF